MSSAASIYWFALIVAIFANIFSNVAFKRAMEGASFESGGSLLRTVGHQPWIWLGLGTAVILLGAYLFAIKRIPLSVAYPSVTGIAMVGIAVSGVVFLGETFPPIKWAALAAVIGGVYVLSQP